jgi:putative DNA primase/helicase
LLAVVSDFPFEQDKHKAAYLCGMLTPMARTAISGPTPFNFIDATVFGSGKSMLADIIGRMYEGRSMTRRVPPTNGAEWQKVMLTVVRSGDPIVLLDNIKGKLGGEALEAVLTGDTFKGRILGVSKDGEGETRAIWYGTGNNATLTPDMVRRSIHVRLKSELENPEARKGFKIPNLLAHALENRAKLLTDVAIILRAYIAAGRPKVKVREMGSYEAWTEQVRHPLAWLGLSDAAETQEELADNADQDTAQLRALALAWDAMHKDTWVTCREVLDSVKADKDSEGNVMALAEDASDLRDAIVGFCLHSKGGVPAAHVLAMRLAKVRDRVVSGVCIQATSKTNQGKKWRVAIPPTGRTKE